MPPAYAFGWRVCTFDALYVISHFVSYLVYAVSVAAAVPVGLSLAYGRWRSLLNAVRRNDTFGLDRRGGDDRRMAVVLSAVEHRSGRDRRRPPRYAVS